MRGGGWETEDRRAEGGRKEGRWKIRPRQTDQLTLDQLQASSHLSLAQEGALPSPPCPGHAFGPCPGVQVLSSDSSLGRPSALWGSSGCGHKGAWLIARDLMMWDPDLGLTATPPNPHLLGPDIPAPDKAVSTPAPRGPAPLELLVVPLKEQSLCFLRGGGRSLETHLEDETRPLGLPAGKRGVTCAVGTVLASPSMSTLEMAWQVRMAQGVGKVWRIPMPHPYPLIIE